MKDDVSILFIDRKGECKDERMNGNKYWIEINDIDRHTHAQRNGGRDK